MAPRQRTDEKNFWSRNFEVLGGIFGKPEKLPTPNKASKLTEWRELSFLEWIIITIYPSLGMIPLAKQQAW